MAILLVGILCFVGAFFAWVVFYATWLRPRMRERWIASRLLSLFAEMVDSSEELKTAGVDSDWLALQLCGLPVESRIGRLPDEIQAKVVRLSHEIRSIGARLVKAGLLRYMEVAFDRQGPMQKICPPKSLFLLTDSGRSLVLELRGRRGKA